MTKTKVRMTEARQRAIDTALRRQELKVDMQVKKQMKRFLLTEQGYERLISLAVSHITGLGQKRALARGSGVQHWKDEIAYYSAAVAGLRIQVE